MYKYYNVAGLTIRMDTFGRTLKQAIPYLCEAKVDADFEIRSAWQRWKSEHPELSDEDCEYLSTGTNFYYNLIMHDGMLLHSSAVVVDGKAYLFTADSGTGKSTHTGLWLKLFGDRAYILNDDKPAVRFENGVWYAYGTPWSGKNDISRNERVPLAGIAVVQRGAINKIEPFKGILAIQSILKQVNRPRFPEPRAKLMELLDMLITQVPIWRLECNMDIEAAVVSYEAMSGNKFKGVY